MSARLLKLTDARALVSSDAHTIAVPGELYATALDRRFDTTRENFSGSVSKRSVGETC